MKKIMIAFAWTVCVLTACDKNKPSQTEMQAFIIRKSKFPLNPERSVQISGKRTKRSVQKKGCTQHL